MHVQGEHTFLRVLPRSSAAATASKDQRTVTLNGSWLSSDNEVELRFGDVISIGGGLGQQGLILYTSNRRAPAPTSPRISLLRKLLDANAARPRGRYYPIHEARGGGPKSVHQLALLSQPCSRLSQTEKRTDLSSSREVDSRNIIRIIFGEI